MATRAMGTHSRLSARCTRSPLTCAHMRSHPLGPRRSSGTTHLGTVGTLDGLDAVDWPATMAAFGPAGTVPGLLRQAVHDDASVRADALRDLWQTVWHQGTVYECTPLVVPFLTRIVVDGVGSDIASAEVVLLLASIATATSFVLPDDPTMRQPAWLGEATAPPHGRDLTVECHGAVAAEAVALGHLLTDAGPATRACLVALLAAVAADLSGVTLARLRPFEASGDLRLAGASRLVRQLNAGTLTEAALALAGSADQETVEYLVAVADWPLEVRAAECARELAERCFASVTMTDFPAPVPLESGASKLRRFLRRGAP